MSLPKVSCNISIKQTVVCHIENFTKEDCVTQGIFHQLTTDKWFIFNDDYFYHKHMNLQVQLINC